MRKPTARRPVSFARPAPPPAPRRTGIVGWIGRLVVLALLAGLVGWVAIFYAYAPELPNLQALREESRQHRVTVLAADGSQVAVRGTKGRAFVDLEEVSPWLVKAVVATEDSRFYRHFGLDLQGTARAFLSNLRAGGVVQGGSTITQQLAKNLFLTGEQTLHRKLQEMILSVWLETQLKKDDILTLYLNRVYLGAGAYGVEAAAQRYFAKPAAELDLAEAAMIAGLLKAPSRFAPTTDLDLARDRAAVVLARMVDDGFIDQGDALAARLAPARLAPSAEATFAGWYVDWIMDQVSGIFGQSGQDLTVTTTLDPRIQKAAEAAVARHVGPDATARGAEEAALVVLDDEGAVRALVGGRTWRQTGFNRAVAAHRQPGSAFKAFVFAAALEAGLKPETVFQDKPVRYGNWQPRNNTGKYRGRVTLQDAFAHSINTVAAQVGARVGVEKVAETGRRLGIGSRLNPVPSLTLGTSDVTLLELTGAYLPFASGGIRRPPFSVLEVTDRRGRSIWRHRATEVRVLEGRTAGTMQQLLVATLEEGTGRAARPGDRLAGGKTGTTQNARDAWFVGFAGEYVAGVWVGNDKATPMRGINGANLPAQIWRDVMRATPKPAAVVASRDTVHVPVRRGGGQRDEGLDWLLDIIAGMMDRVAN